MTKGEEYSIIFEKGYQQGRADQLEDDKGKDWELMLIELGRKESRADVIDECIKIVESTYRMGALEKLEQLKGEH